MGDVNRTFRDIKSELEPNWTGWGKNDHLRGKDDGTVYLHSSGSISNSGPQAMLERQQKWQKGSELVMQIINHEYGPGIGEQIFQKIGGQVGGRDLTKELLRGDLALIDQELKGRTPVKSQLDVNQTGQSQVFGLGPNDVPGQVNRTGTTDQRLTEMFGRPLNDSEIRGLGGIPERCNVKTELVQLDPGIHLNCRDGMSGVQITMQGQDPSGAFRQIEMTVYRDQSGKLNLYRDNTKCNNGQPSGLGACALVRQIDTCRSLGVSTIHNFSSWGRNYNGAYTWARYGGNTLLQPNNVRIQPENDHTMVRGKTNIREQEERQYRNFLEKLGASNHQTLRDLSAKPDLDVQDLMATPEGRDFWKNNSFGIPLTFDLREGSKTMLTVRGHTEPTSCFTLR